MSGNDIIQLNFLETSIVLGLSNFSWLISWFFIAHLKWSCLLRGRLGDTKVETSQVLQGSMALHCHGDALWSPTGPTAVGLGWEMNPVHGQKRRIVLSPNASKCIMTHRDQYDQWFGWIDRDSSMGSPQQEVGDYGELGTKQDLALQTAVSVVSVVLDRKSWWLATPSPSDLQYPHCWLRTYTWSILNQCCSHCCLSGRLVGPFQSKFWSICFQGVLLFCGPY